MAKNSNLDLIITFIAVALIIFISLIINYQINSNNNINSTPSNAHICTAVEKSAQACTLDYNPVCGVDNMTYGNGCAACANKIDYYIKGEC